MKLAIVAVGRMKAGPDRELYDRYAGRITKSGKSLHFSGPDLSEISESRKGTVDQRKSEEADSLLSLAGEGSRIIMLDENGKDISSQDFAALLRDEQEAGTQQLVFAIGGPDGHGEQIKGKAFRTIRLGSMTWPHQLARIMLVEQLYRAITILSGHPYHRE